MIRTCFNASGYDLNVPEALELRFEGLDDEFSWFEAGFVDEMVKMR